MFPNTLCVILEQLQDTQAVLLLYFVIRFNCSSLCWLYKYYDKTSESSLCLNTAEQFECNYSVRPRESESKHFKRQREQSAEVRYTVPQPCKSLLFPLHKSIRRIASPSYERRTLSSLWLWLWSMTKEKVENEKQSERNVCVFLRFCSSRFRLFFFRYFHNPSAGRSEPSVDVNVQPSRNAVQRTDSLGF